MSQIKTKLKLGGMILPAVLFGFVALSSPVKAEEYSTKQKDARMHKALAALENAENLLENAQKGDKGGHRSKALNDTKQAVASTKEAIEYDNTHLSDKELKHQQNKD